MASPLFLLAHGAGAPSSSPWMKNWARLLGRHGKVKAFDYPYMKLGRRAPDKLQVLIEAHRRALDLASKGHRGPRVLIGKSMGSRVGCHLALEEKVDGVVCLGYPLKGMGKAGKLRDEVLLALETQILFVQGTRDNLCPLDVLAEVRNKMSAASELFVVDAGNHSLAVTKTALAARGITQADVDEEILEAIVRFVA
jgi:predicted alpha/beta-hydrolase family hydrolase